jgi:hypothetical protein
MLTVIHYFVYFWEIYIQTQKVLEVICHIENLKHNDFRLITCLQRWL